MRVASMQRFRVPRMPRGSRDRPGRTVRSRSGEPSRTDAHCLDAAIPRFRGPARLVGPTGANRPACAFPPSKPTTATRRLLARLGAHTDHEPWAARCPNRSAWTGFFDIGYDGTLLHRDVFVSVDEDRCYLPLPRNVDDVRVAPTTRS